MSADCNEPTPSKIDAQQASHPNLRFDRYIIQNVAYDIKLVSSANHLTYFGLDFSLLSFIYPRYVGRDENMRKYLYGWLTYFHKKVSPKKLGGYLNFHNSIDYDSRLENRVDLLNHAKNVGLLGGVGISLFVLLFYLFLIFDINFIV